MRNKAAMKAVDAAMGEFTAGIRDMNFIAKTDGTQRPRTEIVRERLTDAKSEIDETLHLLQADRERLQSELDDIGIKEADAEQAMKAIMAGLNALPPAKNMLESMDSINMLETMDAVNDGLVYESEDKA
jgi:hypothetical protein